MEDAKDFVIYFSSVLEVEKFVNIATAQPFPVFLDDGHHQINGKSFMEMFGLSLTSPIRVIAQCSQPELEAFRSAVSHCVKSPLS